MSRNYRPRQKCTSTEPESDDSLDSLGFLYKDTADEEEESGLDDEFGQLSLSSSSDSEGNLYGEDEIATESEVEDPHESGDGDSEYEHSLQSGSIGSTDDDSAGNSYEHSQPYSMSPGIDLSSGNVTPDSPDLQVDGFFRIFFW